jgi:hypothetical protein
MFAAAVLLVSLGSGTINAATVSTVFNPEINTDGTLESVDFFYFSIPNNFILGLFDAADTSFITPLLVNTGNTVTFTPNTPGQAAYTATNDQTTLSINIPTVQNNNAAFILGLKNTTTGNWLADSGATDMSGGAGTAYSVSFVTASGQVLGVDMTLVPVPAAVWLFGSGFVGLVAVARRRT